MGKDVFHSSVEGAQHTPKGLEGFLQFAKHAGARGAQPSNFMLEDGKGGFLSASVIKDRFRSYEIELDGVSAHCPFWVHTTAWTASKTIKPFLPADVAQQSVERIEEWAENYILRLLDLCAELGVRIVPMFWGTAFGWEIATGYPWGFWSGPNYDFIKEGGERFVVKTKRIREQARQLDIRLAHEIHPGTAAVCAEDFLHLVDICGFDPCLQVNADPSHCWEGEDWRTRFNLVADYVVACHMKNHVTVPGPRRSMQAKWPKRAMQFTLLGEGDINLVEFAKFLVTIGYPQRYCQIQGTETAPLVVEAEDAVVDLDTVSADGIKFVNENCCFKVAETSFEAGMGADKK